MTQHKEILIKNSIEKSDLALNNAESNIQNNQLLNAQNRIYYAVFYIFLVMAYLDEFTTGKHHQLMGWFNKKYIYESKIFDKKLGEIYRNAMVNREKFDYEVDKFPEKEQTLKDLDDARYFVNEVKKYILNNL